MINLCICVSNKPLVNLSDILLFCKKKTHWVGGGGRSDGGWLVGTITPSSPACKIGQEKDDTFLCRAQTFCKVFGTETDERKTKQT